MASQNNDLALTVCYPETHVDFPHLAVNWMVIVYAETSRKYAYQTVVL